MTFAWSSPEAFSANSSVAVCFARQYHPIQDELRASVWDGVKRVDSMMEAYFKTVPENLNDDERERLIAYSTAVSRAVLIGAVQRIMNPGGIFRYVPVLIGNQNIGKSTALKNLFGDYHYSTNSNLGSERVAHEIQGKWCMELGDLHAFKISDLDALKNFISRRDDHFRVPYAEYFIDCRRCLIIIATANREEFLRDETGETRWLPLWVGVERQMVDIDGLLRDREQLFAEAYARIDEPVWIEAGTLADEYWEIAKNEATEIDAWHDLIAAWVGTSVLRVTIPHILEHCLFVPKPQWDEKQSKRIGRCLRLMGYRKVRSTNPPHWVNDAVTPF
jgi:putative DNA primase/helicase